jgi:xanthine dehydrogenase accessory factor
MTPARLDTSLELLLEHAPPPGTPRVLATIVATAGSTYRKPGARMFIFADGRHVGLLSGGCLEADLISHARQVLATSAARALEYDMRGPDEVLFGVSAGCEGSIRVLLEPAEAGSRATRALETAAGASARQEPTALIMVHEGTELTLGTYADGAPLPSELQRVAARALANAESSAVDMVAQGGRVRAFVQHLAPPPHLLLCGAGPDAEPVVAAARALGWRVTIADHRPAFIERGRFTGARTILTDAENIATRVDLRRCHAAVIMSHILAADVAYLRAVAAEGGPSYVGLLGPRSRRHRLLQQLDQASANNLEKRLHSPVGLNLGALTPESIALSIVSEVHAWLAGARDTMPQAPVRESDQGTRAAHLREGSALAAAPARESTWIVVSK